MTTDALPQRLRIVQWFIAFLPDPRSSRESAEARRVEALGRATGASLAGRDCLLIGAGEDAHERDEGAPARTVTMVQLTAGARLARANRQRENDGRPPEAGDREPDVDAQLYTRVLLSEDGLSVRSDPLGLLPCYVARLGSGTVVASHLFRLFACFPELVRPLDHVAALDTSALAARWATARSTHGSSEPQWAPS